MVAPLLVPDSYRARIGSITGFLCNGVSPLGIAGVGPLISGLGLTNTLLFMGNWVVYDTLDVTHSAFCGLR
jgi:hypothetical protein